MKRRFLSILLYLVTLATVLQAQSVELAIFWSHPPKKITISTETGDTSYRECKSCPSKSWAGNLEIQGQQSSLVLGQSSFSEVRVDGVFKLTADGRPLQLKYPLLIRAVDGQMHLVATIPLEDYVAIVLNGEASASDPPEYLKALAVAIRTFAFREQDRHKADGFNLCDTTHCQKTTFTNLRQEFTRAAVATKGQMLWYEGKPAQIFFHDHCGGMTAASEEAWPDIRQPYLKQHADPYCLRKTPAEWHAELKKSDIDKALRAGGIALPGGWSTLRIEQRTNSGRVSLLSVNYRGGRKEKLSASSFRFALGRAMGWNLVLSDLYEIIESGEQIVIHGHGHGHGVGLCQTGAAQMAREGSDDRKILAFYFPGTVPGVGAQGFQWSHLQVGGVDVMTTTPERDRVFLPRIKEAMDHARQVSGLSSSDDPQLRIYPDVAAFRNATGEPGWVAAYTQEQTTHIQPLAELDVHKILTNTLRHEFMHQVIEVNSVPIVPLWFREGLVLVLNEENVGNSDSQISDAILESILTNHQDEASLRKAYAAAKARVQHCIETNGKDTVLGWLHGGIPSGQSCR